MENMRQFDREPETNTIKDYLNLIRNNLAPIIIISMVGLLVAIIYAYKAPDIYKATTSLKVSKPQGSILESPLMPEFQDFGSDRFIANEIEILKSYTIRERVAVAMVDSLRALGRTDSFSLIIRSKFNDSRHSVMSIPAIAEMLGSRVSVDQKRGLDIVEISVESTSPYEAALIANNYASAYNELNLMSNRQQLTLVKSFLAEQKKEKQSELNKAEDSLKRYQQKGGIIALDEQAKSLIEQLSAFEAQMNAANIDYSVSSKNLEQYRESLKKQDPRLADYLESFAAEPYLKALQEEIAKLETKKDLVSTGNDPTGLKGKAAVDELDRKIEGLKKKVKDKISVYKAGIFASSPEEVKLLSQKIIEEDIKNQASKATYLQLKGIVSGYEGKFNSLPKATIDLAKLERQRQAYEKLYLLVEEKYQEALINEQSQPGNVQIIDVARRPFKPSKPNRMLIVVIGLVLGVGMGVGFAFVRDYFDNTIKTPDDIQKKGVNVLAWIPQIDGLGIDGNKEFEFVVARKPDSIPAEAFRALRTRVLFSKKDKNAIKTLLVTSSAPQEGKTTISVNLAGSFAHSNKKTIIIDCDLRKPRMHNVFRANRYPGFTDYFFGQATFEEILRTSEIPNLNYITAGTIPPNPSEILGSPQMEEFLQKLRDEYDIIMLDSPPIIAVTDSEILSRIVDASILVASANTTEIDLLQKSVELLRHEKNTFIGVLLNNFSYRAGYGSYYKYYYYYSRPKEESSSRFRKTTKV